MIKKDFKIGWPQFTLSTRDAAVVIHPTHPSPRVDEASEDDWVQILQSTEGEEEKKKRKKKKKKKEQRKKTKEKEKERQPRSLRM